MLNQGVHVETGQGTAGGNGVAAGGDINGLADKLHWKF
jgi:hypothetical protein